MPGAQVACHYAHPYAQEVAGYCYFLVVERILKGRGEFEFVVEGVNGDECGEALACFSRGTLDLSEVERLSQYTRVNRSQYPYEQSKLVPQNEIEINRTKGLQLSGTESN